jgi:hypothetical protein
MNTEAHLRTLTPEQYAMLREQAKQDAVRLRQAAIDAAWRGATRFVRLTLRALRRGVASPTKPRATELEFRAVDFVDVKHTAADSKGLTSHTFGVKPCHTSI